MLHKNRNNIGKNWDIFKPILKKNYNWSSVFTGFTTANSTNLRAKVFRKNSKMFQGHFNLLSADNYLHSIYITYSTVYIAFTLYSVQFSPSVVSDSLPPHGLQHTRPPCLSPTPRVYSNSCPLSWWCHPTILSSVVLFSSCLQSFPASGSFPVGHFFTSGGQSIGVSASASVLLMNTQDWFPLG